MAKVVLLAAGLVVAGLIGYFTRPDAAEIKLGGVSIEIQSGDRARVGAPGSITTGQWQHIGVFAIGGAAFGLLIGFLADRRRA